MKVIQETGCALRVEVHYRQGQLPMQSFNAKDLDHLWRLVGRFKQDPKVRRIRVWAELTCFEITES